MSLDARSRLPARMHLDVAGRVAVVSPYAVGLEVALREHQPRPVLRAARSCASRRRGGSSPPAGGRSLGPPRATRESCPRRWRDPGTARCSCPTTRSAAGTDARRSRGGQRAARPAPRRRRHRPAGRRHAPVLARRPPGHARVQGDADLRSLAAVTRRLRGAGRRAAAPDARGHPRRAAPRRHASTSRARACACAASPTAWRTCTAPCASASAPRASRT